VQTQFVNPATMILQVLKVTIKKYNIDLKDLFKKYDKSDNQLLEEHEFAKMMR
jgi:hypothetical protein